MPIMENNFNFWLVLYNLEGLPGSAIGKELPC